MVSSALAILRKQTWGHIIFTRIQKAQGFSCVSVGRFWCWDVHHLHFFLEGFELKGCSYWHVPLALNLGNTSWVHPLYIYYFNKLLRHLPFYSSWSYGLVGPLLRLVKYDRFQPSESLRQGFFPQWILMGWHVMTSRLAACAVASSTRCCNFQQMAVGALLIDHCKGGRQSMHIFSKWSSSVHLVLCGY